MGSVEGDRDRDHLRRGQPFHLRLLALLALAPEERASLAAELFDSLAPEDPLAAEAWEQTFARRVAELARGEVTTIPAEQVFAKFGRFHPEASAELTEAHDWYAARNARAASEFIDEVLRATESIRDAPERWAIGRHGERRLPRQAEVTCEADGCEGLPRVR